MAYSCGTDGSGAAKDLMAKYCATMGVASARQMRYLKKLAEEMEVVIWSSMRMSKSKASRQISAWMSDRTCKGCTWKAAVAARCEAVKNGSES
eukprot:4409949-Amphidinium_carterae.2